MYCLPSDILDEGASAVCRNLARRALVNSITVPALYHCATDICPHYPKQYLVESEAGSFVHFDGRGYARGGPRPLRSRGAGSRDILDESFAEAGRWGLSVAAWAVLLHDDYPQSRPSAASQVDCFGRPRAHLLCPTSPAARSYVFGVVEELARRGVSWVRAESAHFGAFAHGGHHERVQERVGFGGRLLLGLCFCVHCQAAALRRGVDVARLQQLVRSTLDRMFSPPSLRPPATGCPKDIKACRTPAQ